MIRLHPGPEGTWTVGRSGATATLPAVRGFDHLRRLLRHPGTDIAATDLAGGTVTDTSTAEVADHRALAAYRARLRALDADLAEAASWGDEGRRSRLGLEREALLAELRAATGLGGRPRRFPAAQERARVAVRKAVAAALQRIETHDPGLARLLRDTVRTGAFCRYEPDPARPVSWLLDP